MDEEKKQPTVDGRAKEYHRIRLGLSLLKVGLGLAFLLFLLLSGASKGLEALFSVRTANPWLVAGGYFLSLSLLAWVLSLPLSYHAAFTIEHRYGLSNETRKGWFLDEIKALLLGMALGGVLIELLYFLLRRFPQWWWLPAFGVFCLFYVLLARVGPVLIVPLFFTFKEIEDEELRGRLLRLAEKASLHVRGVYELNLSKKTKAANAALMGLGKTRRIVLGDTLLRKFEPDEIEAVLAHELGHQKHQDMWLGIGASALVSFCGLFAAHRALDLWAPALGFSGPSAVGAFPLLALSLFMTSLALLVPSNALTRWYERRADAFSIRLTGKPDALINALSKLADMNLADREPHPLLEFLFYTHPSIRKRIAHVEAVKTTGDGGGSH